MPITTPASVIRSNIALLDLAESGTVGSASAGFDTDLPPAAAIVTSAARPKSRTLTRPSFLAMTQLAGLKSR